MSINSDVVGYERYKQYIDVEKIRDLLWWPEFDFGKPFKIKYNNKLIDDLLWAIDVLPKRDNYYEEILCLYRAKDIFKNNEEIEWVEHVNSSYGQTKLNYKNITLDKILFGKNIKICILKKIPKDGERFCYWNHKGVLNNGIFAMSDDYSILLYKIGNYYTTIEDANKNKNFWVNFYNNDNCFDLEKLKYYTKV